MNEQQYISQLLQQNKLLIEMVCTLSAKVNNLEAKTENIHRLFNSKPLKKSVKKLSLKQQRAKDLKEEIEAERLAIVQSLSQK